MVVTRPTGTAWSSVSYLKNDVAGAPTDAEITASGGQLLGGISCFNSVDLTIYLRSASGVWSGAGGGSITSYQIWFDGSNYHAVSASGGTNYVGPLGSTAFATAWNALTSGGTIFIRAGTLPIIATPTLNANPNITLDGEGPASIIQLSPGASRAIISISASISNLRIRNLQFDGNGTNQTNFSPASLINLSSVSSSGLTIENCLFQNARNSCIVAAGSHIRITNNRFINNTIATTNGLGFGNFVGVIILTGNANQLDVRILNNDFNNNIWGCIVDADLGSRGVLIQGNSFTDNIGQPNIINNAMLDLSIIGNLFYSNVVGFLPEFILLAAATNLIQGNFFWSGSTTMLEHIYDNIPIYNQIIGNTFTGGPSVAIILTALATNGGNYVVANNIFQLSGSNMVGISLIALTGYVVTGNTFYMPFAGIPISFDGTTACTNGVVEGNILVGATTAIRFNITPTNSLIVNNPGYNPQPVSGVLTAGASPYTVPAQLYPYIFLLQAANGISATTLDGVAVPITVNQPILVNPGHALILTWTVTAPTFKELPQ